MPDAHSASGCLLCDEVTDAAPLSSRLGLYPTRRGPILAESGRFLVIRDIAPVVPGHALLITRTHFRSFAEVPREALPEAAALFREALAALPAGCPKPFLFEHGSTSGVARSGACVEHAHIHILPVDAPILSWLDGLGDLRDYDVLTPRSPAPGPLSDYLWCRDPHGRARLVTALETALPCQFIRRALASHLGLDQWNWKAVLASVGPIPGSAPRRT